MKLEAGPELDKLVAEVVMGQVPCDKWRPFMHDSQIKDDSDCEHEACYPADTGPCHYSRNISAAWQVVEKLCRDGRKVYVFNHPDGWHECDIDGVLLASAPSAPLAICRAALKAMGYSDG